MSFFSLFGYKSPRTAEALPEQSVPDNGSNTQPASSGGARKSVRLGQRELLYGVVRDVMIRAGVLVASYRFKVLSLDAQGRQYLIMMDLLKVEMEDMKRLREIESMIVQVAKVRHDLVVTGVYWRNELQKTTVGVQHTPRPASDAVASVPRQPKAISASKNLRRNEIEPLKHPITRAAGEKLSQNEILSARKKHRASSPEFEDTRIIEPNEYGSQLSATQYGDLE